MEGKASQRIFIAVNLPISAKKDILNLQQSLNNQSFPVNWTPITNFHITLLFLGNLASWDVKKLSGVLDDVVGDTKIWDLHLTRLGIIKDGRRPRLLYIKAKDSRQLSLLQARLAPAVQEAGISRPGRRGFLPHVTIGRFRQGNLDKKLWGQWRRTKIDIGFSVRSFDIMESLINNQPVHYKKIHSSYFSEF